MLSSGMDFPPKPFPATLTAVEITELVEENEGNISEVENGIIYSRLRSILL